MHYQHTLQKTAFLSGIGLHSGNPVSVALHPAPPNTGVVFSKQVDDHVETCPATIVYLGQTDHCTTLQSHTFQIQTVEHILSALAGLEIDNAYVEIQGSEIPAADGSADPFAEIIQQCGIIAQEEPRTYLKVVHPISVESEQGSISVLPSALPEITYFIDFPHPAIQQQEYRHACSPLEFQKNIARARTFSFRKEVEYLWSRGLGLGGSLNNTLVFSDTDLVNEDGFRYPDECVRHKILDFIGDLSLLGMPVIGHFIARCAGHALHSQMVQAILQNPDKWIILNGGEMKDKDLFKNHTSLASPVFPFEPQPVFNGR